MTEVPGDTIFEGQVGIVGAGPVGITLAIDLALRGVQVILIEKSSEDAEPAGRCNHISARSLEMWRRLGVASKVRKAGLPDDFPHDASYVTSMVGRELTRIKLPSRNDRFSKDDFADSGWPTPEPPHRCNQIYFDPILRRRVREMPGVTILYDTEITGVSDEGDHTLAHGIDLERGGKVTIKCDYLVGCDGGNSLVRKAMGTEFVGDGLISQTRSVFIRSCELREKANVDRAWMTWFVGNPTYGCLISLNGEDHWVFLLWLPEGVSDFEALDPRKAIRNAFGKDFDFTIEKVDDWYGRRLVADHFHKGRLLLCGDASHIWIPFAGYGMNAGVADAATLGWQLAAVINGWGGPSMLDAYQAERQPVTHQVSQQAMSLALSNLNMEHAGKQVDVLNEDSKAGEKAREKIGRELYETNFGQFACIGLNFGTYYESSPIIAHEAQPAPTYTLETYTPSTIPGCRTPHFWLESGESVYDRLGDGYTVLRFDPAVDVGDLVSAARDRGVPIEVLDVGNADVPPCYDTALVISRPDQHVAWRGNTVPERPAELIDLLRGAAAKPLAKKLEQAKGG